jgi:hypothetical protein
MLASATPSTPQLCVISALQILFCAGVGMRAFSILIFAALTVSLAGCGEVNRVNKGLDRINSMDEKTQKLSDASCELYDALRQGNTLDSRRRAIDNLLNNTKDEAAKIAQGAEYFMGFEFQLWSNACQDQSDHKRDLLMALGVQEFLRQVQEFFPDNDLSPDPSAQSNQKPYSDKNLTASLNALAATVHLLNPKQQIRADNDPTFKTYSMLDILEEGLAMKAKINSGEIPYEQIPEHVKEVLMQEKYAVALLQARYNIAVAIAIDGISDIHNGFFRQMMMYLKSWTAQMDRPNAVQLHEYQEYVKDSAKIGAFLKSIGVTPEINNDLKKVINNMQYDPNQKSSEKRRRDETKLIESIRQFAAGKTQLTP